MVAQPGQPKQPGMMAQMAATAGSVAVGSTIGHGLSSMLFGGGSREASAPVPEAYPVQNQTQQSFSGASCELQAKGKSQPKSFRSNTRTNWNILIDFTKCLETGDVTTCGWYLEQLRAVSYPKPVYVLGQHSSFHPVPISRRTVLVTLLDRIIGYSRRIKTLLL